MVNNEPIAAEVSKGEELSVDMPVFEAADVEAPVTPQSRSGQGIALKGVNRRPHAIEVVNLDYEVSVPHPETQEVTQRKLLNDISITIQPCTLTAIMGSTGAGKTTMLNALAARLQPTGGCIKVNGRDTAAFPIQRRLGYVMQDDKLPAQQTVRETLMFGARLLLPEKTTKQQCEERVQNIIEELGLQLVADQMVGADKVGARGISGGERKRVAIGLVLIPDPDILLLDEPTTGLDSFTAESVTDTLRELAEAGRTIICTVHQPSSQLFKTFTNLLLMSSGRIVYFGKAAESMEYFESQGFPVPQYTNPPDFYMKLLRTGLSGADEKGSLRDLSGGDALSQKLGDLWVASALNRSKPRVVEDDVQDSGEPEDQAAGFMRQYSELAGRSLRSTLRDPILFRARVVASAFLGLIVGMVFFDTDDTPSGVHAKQGALFFMNVNQAMMSLNGVLHTFPSEISLVMRESQANMYSVSAYFWAKTAVELPFMALFPSIYVSVLYYMVGFREDPEYLFQTVSIVVLLACVAQSAGMLISAAAPTFEMAMTLGPLVFLPMALMAGFLTQDLPVWLSWLQKVSFIKWAFEGVAYNEFHGRALSCPDNGTAAATCSSSGDMLLENLDIGEARVWRSVLILVGYFVGLRLLTWFVLLRKSAAVGGIQQ
eukprot:TRINITY_DN1214_c0_g1_i6.p1 TRINITY_DN1214_c0_g1~~TRINITY_DN1214_c0_g1_i6.p1  ORF type:complete len:688 (+),score=334.14 TRINITY_DN1214_c0_g1_i6:95-2065(+)